MFENSTVQNVMGELVIGLVLVTIGALINNYLSRVKWGGRRTFFMAVVGVILVVCVCVVLVIDRSIPDDENEDKNTTGSSNSDLQATSRELPFAFGRTNDHCSGGVNVNWRVDASEGWRIDPETIKPKVSVQSRKSSFQGIHDRSEDGFLIKGRVVNHGDCIRVFGRVVARDARGTLRVSGTYRENRQVVADSSLQ